MTAIVQLITEHKDRASSRPVFFNLAKISDEKSFKKLLKSGSVRVVDEYESQLREQFEIKNPPLVFSSDFDKQFSVYSERIEKRVPLYKQGRWVYFPWRGTVTHILEDTAFQEVRTARNKNLITAEEQKKFYNSTIGIAGLSVGNSIALAIVLQGGGRHLKLADHDTLGLSNLNRIRTSVDNLGLKKVDMTARQIYEIDPYAKIEIFSEGLTKKNIKLFFQDLDIVIDEIDNLAMKYRIREYAKKYSLPLIMAADNSDGSIVDIERYDIDKNTRFFENRFGPITLEQLEGLGKIETGEMITKFIGYGNISKRMELSLVEIGKTLSSWPQLGGATFLNGASASFLVRSIINGSSVKGRSIVSFDKILRI